MLELNVLAKHELFIKLQNIMKSPRVSNYSLDEESIGSILELERCPLLTTFWQNLLKYTIFDVSFGENNIETLKIQYQYDDINISVIAQSKDVVAYDLLYKCEKISLEGQTLEKDIKTKFGNILQEFLEIIDMIAPETIPEYINIMRNADSTNNLCFLACKR